MKDTNIIYDRALHKWGAANQMVVALEEMAELQKELCKNMRGIGNTEHIAEEIADVQIMLEQMILLFDVEDTVEEYKKAKLRRLEERLNDEVDY